MEPHFPDPLGEPETLLAPLIPCATPWNSVYGRGWGTAQGFQEPEFDTLSSIPQVQFLEFNSLSWIP